MNAPYDVAIVGAGHNGLVAAGYLSRAGCRVIVLEARPVVGGACVSEELIPGAKWSSCAFVRGLLRDEIVAELELEKYGLETFAPDVQGFALFKDGSHLFLWQELDRTLKEIERYSKRDAERFLEFGTRFKRFGELTREWLLRPPPRLSEVIRTFEEAGEDELIDDFLLGSAKDLVSRYFESEHIRGFLTFFGIVSVWGGPSTPGTGYVYGHHASGEYHGNFGRWSYVKGGMGGITQAMARSAAAYGTEVRLSSPVERINVKDGTATGVYLRSGEEIQAEVVISNADPKRSLLKMIEANVLDANFREKVERIDQRGSMARIHLLVDELPHYLGFPDAEPGPQHRGHQMLGASVENFERAWEAQRRGEFAEEYAIEALTQSVLDPSLAPQGRHTLTLGVQQLPIELGKGTWDTRREAWADQVVETLCRYAPNLKDHILERVVITPLDLEREYNLTGGNIFQAAMTMNQLFAARPIREISDYRTPIANYYLCGAGMHPGGGVMGAPGHNAALTVLGDLKGETETGEDRSKVKKSRQGLVDRIMKTPTGRKLGYKVARSRAMRPITALATKTRKD
jgi:phytoene dehydrogenase-like protein